MAGRRGARPVTRDGPFATFTAHPGEVEFEVSDKWQLLTLEAAEQMADDLKHVVESARAQQSRVSAADDFWARHESA